VIKKGHFICNEYLRNFKDISSATVSRDLKFAVENGFIEKFGDKKHSKIQVYIKTKN
jgi:predicted HTH transcriptional regulator